VLNLDEMYPVKPFDPELQEEAVTWLIEGVWQRGKINAVFAPEKSGKSRLLAWLLSGLMGSANETLGLKIASRPQRLLYLLGEETQATVQQRLMQYAKLQQTSTEFSIDFIDASGMRLETERYRKWLAEKLSDGYDGLLVDPLRRVHGGDENDNTQMSHLFNDLRRWSNSYGVSIIIVHHTGKLQEGADHNRIATWSRGATDLAAIVDTAMFVNRLTQKQIQVIRAGRFPPLPSIYVNDHTDAKGFEFAKWGR
jgi:RecA-family ATPase